MKYSHIHRIPSLILLLTLLCLGNTVGRGAHLQRIKLTDHDRASIIGAVIRNIFKPGSNYEGKYFVLAEHLRPQWIPKLAGYDVSPVNAKQIESSSTPLYYYVLWLRSLKRSVHVTVHLYDSENRTDPHVILFYSYRRSGQRWRGRFLGGGGD